MRRVGFAAAVIGLALAIVAAWAREDSIAVQIYPTADRLPANLLRLYVVFDRPMRAGESRERLTLLDDTHRPVESAFLELEEELWDATGKRLTVLFDPGRIKRGLRANLESGAPLVEGRRYRLVIDAGWRDSGGRRLAVTWSKAFEVVAPDRTSPVVKDWIVDAPAAGTRLPLVLRFPEILDRALLASTIIVVDSSGTQIRGVIDAGGEERTWSLRPDHAWRQGDYELRVSSELEDVAGNSLRRLFDADMTPAVAVHDAVPPVVTRSFTLRH